MKMKALDKLRATGSTVIPCKDIPFDDEISKLIDNNTIATFEKKQDGFYHLNKGEEQKNEIKNNPDNLYYVIPKVTKEEFFINKEIKKRVATRKVPPALDDIIKRYETLNKVSLDEVQKDAVKMFCSNSFGVLTGGPGTGKTSVLKCALYSIKELRGKAVKLNIRLLAPTGKAARRLSEATGEKAETILGAMKYNPIKQKPMLYVNADYVFVDESSMIDTTTMYWLLATIPYTCKIFFIGDTQQLPAVGKGSILRDMMQSKIIPRTNLVKTFRQKEGSTLLENIKIVKEGYKRPFVSGNDFLTFTDYKEFLPLYFLEVKKRGIENVAILTPTRKAGEYCSEKLNHLIQTRLNRNEGVKAKVIRDDRNIVIPFRLGDPVMQLVNREVANGEIGTVISINPFKVQFTDKVITYSAKELFQLDLAYAVSIHKSQGSEYEAVFVLATEEGNLDKNMLYTAITRAKKICYVFGKESTIKEACKIQTSMERLTALNMML